MKRIGCLFATILLGLSVSASEPPVLPVWPDRDPGTLESEEKVRNLRKDAVSRFISNVKWPTMTVHLPDAGAATGAAVVICPGGGYGGVAIDMEGHDVAKWLNTLGAAGIVLKYRMPRAAESKGELPYPLQDAQRAIRTVRARAAAWKIDPRKVGILGFSAGGHLASTAATHYDAGKPDAADPVVRQGCRPDFAILVYPVISLVEPFTHTGSRKNLLGKDAGRALLERYSNELQVDAKTPPTFLIHAKDDPVKVENSLAFAAALKKVGVPHRLQLYEKGGHGFGLGIRGGKVAEWPKRCAEWMRELKLVR
jgi:acetyl esterase/lipase